MSRAKVIQFSGKRRQSWRFAPRKAQNFRGPNRALPYDEQLEIQRLMREAEVFRKRGRTAKKLAVRYGVSERTIWRYAETIPTPPGFEYLGIRLRAWAKERDIVLTHDDWTTLLFVIARHRDFQRVDRAVA